LPEALKGLKRFGIWFLAFEIWFLGFGSWNLVLGSWNLEFGSWDLDLGPSLTPTPKAQLLLQLAQ